eukprot:3285520-Pyramimonas_sp.AAC.1
MRYNRLLDMRRRRLQVHRPRREACGASARHWAVTHVAQGLRRAGAGARPALAALATQACPAQFAGGVSPSAGPAFATPRRPGLLRRGGHFASRALPPSPPASPPCAALALGGAHLARRHFALQTAEDGLCGAI